VAVCLCVKNRLSHNFKPRHVVSLCIVLVTWPFQPFVFYQRQNSHNKNFASWGKIDSIFSTWVMKWICLQQTTVNIDQHRNKKASSLLVQTTWVCHSSVWRFCKNDSDPSRVIRQKPWLESGRVIDSSRATIVSQCDSIRVDHSKTKHEW